MSTGPRPMHGFLLWDLYRILIITRKALGESRPFSFPHILWVTTKNNDPTFILCTFLHSLIIKHSFCAWNNLDIMCRLTVICTPPAYFPKWGGSRSCSSITIENATNPSITLSFSFLLVACLDVNFFYPTLLKIPHTPSFFVFWIIVSRILPGSGSNFDILEKLLWVYPVISKQSGHLL